MKKNKLFLLGLFVVFAAVLSLSLVSNTLAKYTSTNNGTDTARVAKWGVTVNFTNFDMFEEEYDIETTGTGLSGKAVSSASTDEVLAPGTSGSLTGIAVTGTPEVAVKVTYDADLALTNWLVDPADPATEYFPVVITVQYGSNVNHYAREDSETLAQFEARVENAIRACTTNYEAKADLSEIDDDLVISWAWAFSTSEANDAKDTALGGLSPAPTISLKVTCTVTQID